MLEYFASLSIEGPAYRRPAGYRDMNQDLALALIAVLALIAWVIAKVVRYSRQSDEQWKKVDRTKLREWDDELD